MKLNRKVLRNMILMEIRRVLKEQQIETSSSAANQYIQEYQEIINSTSPGPERNEKLSTLKKRMGVQKVENIKDSQGNIINKKVIFKNTDPGPSYTIPAKFEEEEDQD